MKKYKNGFVVGKFMPVHNGHVFLINTAIAQCEQVTILLLSNQVEPISGVTRLQWLRELFPDCIIAHIDQSLPRDESGYDHWDVWLKAIIEVCGNSFDAVFSSESYGERLATDLNAAHILVDQVRTTVPVSGSAIRSNPKEHFHYLPAIVKTYYEN